MAETVTAVTPPSCSGWGLIPWRDPEALRNPGSALKTRLSGRVSWGRLENLGATKFGTKSHVGLGSRHLSHLHPEPVPTPWTLSGHFPEVPALVLKGTLGKWPFSQQNLFLKPHVSNGPVWGPLGQTPQLPPTVHCSP